MSFSKYAIMKILITNKFIFFLILISIPYLLNAQSKEKLTIPMFSAAYMVQVPGGDLAERYGINSNIGGSFTLKLKNNFFLELNPNFIFGNNLKGDALTIFEEIETSNGNIININGEYAKVVVFQRGFYAGGRVGKMFPISSNNLNSGIVLSVGAGLLQHRIRIENDGNNTPQINFDYRKGYDKLTNGFSLTQFIGFMHISKHKLINYYFGFEFYQAWTESRRTYDFNLMGRDDRKRIDLLSGLKVGWIIPIYKRQPDPFYFN